MTNDETDEYYEKYQNEHGIAQNKKITVSDGKDNQNEAIKLSNAQRKRLLCKSRNYV